MPAKGLRFATMMLAALSTGMAFCHLMELPARIGWDRDLWVGSTVEGGLYRMFGTIGAVIVVVTVALGVWLAWRLRNGPRAVFLYTALAATLFALALGLWWAVVFPANLELARWLNGPVPPDWSDTRLRWEAGHAVNALLQIAGLGVLHASVLADKRD
ncbi:MAG: hypothetical protein AB7U38_01490 [Hyphomicrobiales bacterium]